MVKKVKKIKGDYRENNAMGLALGILIAGIHALWLILVYVGLGRIIIDWIYGLHMMKLTYSITAFSSGKALGLLILTFIVGYVAGWFLAALLKMTRNMK